MIEKVWPLLIAAAVLWTAAGALAITTTFTGSLALALWAALAAMKASMVTLWVMMESIAARERLRVEEIAQLIATGISDCREVTPLRR